MKKKLGFIAIAAALLVASSAYASGTSSASIIKSSTGVDGNHVSMSGTVYVSGTNNFSSTNDLWVELYEDLIGPDTIENHVMIYPNREASFALNESAGKYYIHLDPDGPFMTGCTGFGDATN